VSLCLGDFAWVKNCVSICLGAPSLILFPNSQRRMTRATPQQARESTARDAGEGNASTALESASSGHHSLVREPWYGMQLDLISALDVIDSLAAHSASDSLTDSVYCHSHAAAACNGPCQTQ
jgi:hypothetical protein